MKVINKDGEITGYIIQIRPIQYHPKHPNAWKSGYIRAHRVTAATALGKSLPSHAIVHEHPDGLVIGENQSYHILLHMRERAYTATGDPNKRQCKYCKKYDDLSNLQMRHNGRAHPDSYVFCHKSCSSEYGKRFYRQNQERYYASRLEGE
jgi:hypothetical protein